MAKRTKVVLTAAAGLALAAGGAGVAIATSDDDDAGERPISGAALERAGAAALKHTGGGTVSETEVGDEESTYEVEVTLPDGSQTDVQLDRRFEVVGADPDGEDDERGDEQ